jgi:hypothetical protein
MATRWLLRLVFVATPVVASGALQWCVAPRSCFRTHRQRPDTSIRASTTNYANDENVIKDNVKVFLRFSPLIGGPPIPLHVEVILAEDDENKCKDVSKGTIYIRKTNDLSSMAFLNTYPQLHRLDFLPENPTDPSTVVRLVSLQSVPGKLRHRYYTQNITSSDASQDGRGITVLLPVGSIPCINKDNFTSNDIISTALKFTNERRDHVYDDLRIFLGKNCLSFALDLLIELNNEHGIQRVDSWDKIDFG